MWHRCNLAAKESGLECTCVSNDNFTVLVSGVVDTTEGAHVLCGHHIQNDWASRTTNTHQILHQAWTFLLETTQMTQKAAAMGSGWLAASSQQRACSCITSHAEFFLQNIKSLGDLAPLQTRFEALWLLTFLQTKIIFEREEISDHHWDLGEYTGAADGNWKNSVRSQGAYF